MIECLSSGWKIRNVIRSLLNIKRVCLILFFYSFNSFGQESSVKSISLFNGKSLNGWKTVNPADQSLWSVVDSVIVCSNSGKKIEANTYLQYDI